MPLEIEGKVTTPLVSVAACAVPKDVIGENSCKGAVERLR